MKVRWLLPILLVVFLDRPRGHHQTMIFSSTNHLRQLNLLENQLGSLLSQHVLKTERVLGLIKSYLSELSAVNPRHSDQQRLEGRRDDYEDSSNLVDSVGQDDDAAFNPLLAFHTLRRLAIDFKPIYDFFKTQTEVSGVLGLIESQAHMLPLEKDLHTAALTLVRLQDTYDLNVTRMAHGSIMGIDRNVGLSARDCLYLGKHSFNNGFYGHALSWFDQALKLASDHAPDGRHFDKDSINVDELLAFRRTVLEVHEESLKERLKDEENWSSLNDPPQFRIRELGSDQFDQSKFHRLCRGERLLAASEASKLKCYYSARGRPFLLLQPVKVEEQHLNPMVLQFHDLISDAEAANVQDLATPMLNRAMVQGMGDKRLESTERISQTAWLHPDQSPLVRRLNRRVEMVTGLSTDMSKEHSEVMQVANYGIGGFYQPHFDYLIVDKTEQEKSLMDPIELIVGDRTATLMFYFSDVIRGGATVFPRLGVGLVPKKGSAVFWYNLKQNGLGEEKTLHGGCPVLYGQKWVGNYWFREIGQTFRRRCSTNKDE